MSAGAAGHAERLAQTTCVMATSTARQAVGPSQACSSAKPLRSHSHYRARRRAATRSPHPCSRRRPAVAQLGVAVDVAYCALLASAPLSSAAFALVARPVGPPPPEPSRLPLLLAASRLPMFNCLVRLLPTALLFTSASKRRKMYQSPFYNCLTHLDRKVGTHFTRG